MLRMHAKDQKKNNQSEFQKSAQSINTHFRAISFCRRMAPTKKPPPRRHSEREPKSLQQQHTHRPAYEIGSKHWVLHPENFPCLAEILDIRIASHARGTRKVESHEFYVHLMNFDKRLDQWIDREHFLTSEERDAFWRERGTQLLPQVPDISKMTTQRTLGRALQRRLSEQQQSNAHQQLSAPSLAFHSNDTLAQLEREHEDVTRVRNIERIQLGTSWDIDCWYYSPYPDEYGRPTEYLYICENCLKYMHYRETLIRHQVCISSSRYL